MRKKHKNTAIIAVLIIAVSGLFAYADYSRTRAESIAAEEARIRHLVRKGRFADDFGFELRMIDEHRTYSDSRLAQEFINPRHPFYNPFFTDIVFVCTEEEASNYPNNIIVAWPTLNTVVSIQALGETFANNQDNLMPIFLFDPHSFMAVLNAEKLSVFKNGGGFTAEELFDNPGRAFELFFILNSTGHGIFREHNHALQATTQASSK